MNEPIKTIIKVGKYTFQIIENTSIYEGRILSRNFKIGGDKDDCVSVSIKYQNNQPIFAKIPYVMHDPECSFDVHLDRGGSVIMIKTLLNHVHTRIPSLTEVEFDDTSKIEGATENEINTKGSKNPKRGTHVTPILLYYFSIAFNGQTWYEKHFQAKLKDPRKYEIYRENVQQMLYSQELKTNVPFNDFLEKYISSPEIAHKLKKYYNESDTFGGFFQSIPFSERINLVRDWIETFMDYYLKDIFSNKGWIIHIPLPNGNMDASTNLSASEKKGGKKRKTRKYYCPKGRILHFTSPLYHDVGADVNDPEFYK
jgi:hypothetical protein